MDHLSSWFGRENQPSGPSTFMYNEGDDILVAPLESTAHRTGVLEKASKEFLKWKPRRCVLISELFCYSKAESPISNESPSPSKTAASAVAAGEDLTARTWARVEERKAKEKRRWTCIPLRNCLHIIAVPHDPRIFLLQTKARAYYWRATKETECQEWLASIAAQCTIMRESDLLREAEERIVAEEEQRSSQMLGFLESLRQLEGALLFSDTRELLEGLAVDYFRSREEQQGMSKAEQASQSHHPPPNLAGPKPQEETRNVPLNEKVNACPATTEAFTADEVLAYIRSYQLHSRRGFRTEQSSTGNDTRRAVEIHRWIKAVLFPLFMTSSIIQRRVAQVAASRNVVSWGCDPLRSPLLCFQGHTAEAEADLTQEEGRRR